MAKNLFKSQKKDITGCCSNVILLKLNKFLPSGILPCSFVTKDSFYQHTEMKWISLKHGRPTLSISFYFQSGDKIQHNFKASLGGLVPIFYNCSDYVYRGYTSSFHSSDILRHGDQLVLCNFVYIYHQTILITGKNVY